MHSQLMMNSDKKKNNDPDQAQDINEPQVEYNKSMVVFNSFEEMNKYDHQQYALLTPEESLAQVTHLRLLKNPNLNKNLNPWGNKIYID